MKRNDIDNPENHNHFETIESSFETLKIPLSYKVLQFFKNERKLIAAITLFCSSWMLIYVLTSYQPKFLSKSMVLIKDSAITSRYILPDQNYSLQTTSSSASNPILNAMGFLKSSFIMESLWEFYRTRHPEELKKLNIKTFEDWQLFYRDGSALLKTKNLPGTDLISIQYAWGNPLIAKESLDTILEAFQNTSREINRAEQKSRSHYLDNQVEEISTRLKTIRQKKSAYKSQMKTINLVKESEDLSHARIELNNQLATILAKSRGKRAEFKNYMDSVGMSPKEALAGAGIGLNKSMTKLQDQLYTLAQNAAYLKTTLTDKNPKVQEVDSQLAQVREQIKNEISRTVQPPLRNKKIIALADTSRGQVANQMITSLAESKSLHTEAYALQTRIKEIDSLMQIFPNMEENLANIEQEEKSLSAALDNLRQKQLEAHLKEAETLSNVFIIDQPKKPLREQFPTIPHLLILGLIIGLSSGILTAYLKNQYLQIRKENRFIKLKISEFRKIEPSHYSRT